jgi:hypothetical protein
MPPISNEEYRQHLDRLGESVDAAGLDLYIISSFDSIYYLTGAGFEPLDRSRLSGDSLTLAEGGFKWASIAS